MFAEKQIFSGLGLQTAVELDLFVYRQARDVFGVRDGNAFDLGLTTAVLAMELERVWFGG